MRHTHELVSTIVQDRTSGATQLTTRTIEVFQSWLSESEGLDLKKVRASLREIGSTIVQAHPVMASILNLVNRILWTAEDASSLEALHEDIALLVEEFARTARRQQNALLKNALALLPNKSRIVTLSFSSTVLETLTAAQGKNRRLEVICAESRPLYEGVELAKQLGAAGISCELVIDARAPSCVEHADLVLVGGDGITSANLINKIGTYPLALAARWHHVPCVALVTTQKIFPVDISPQLPTLDPAEVLISQPPNVRVTNTYFEEVPLALISTVMTDAGPLDRRAIARLMRWVKTHPSLKQIL
jgi:translation initiation factor 2B subunit (eIF-2B alpha/beta/delta family)